MHPRISKIVNLFLSGHSPQKLALASFAGIAIGTSPFYGLHLLLSFATAALFKINAALIYLWANISLPVFAPFIIFVSYQLGYFLCNGTWSDISWTALDRNLWHVILYWWLGSVILGLLLGLPVAVIVYLVSAKMQSRQPLTSEEIPAPYFQLVGKLAQTLRGLSISESIRAYSKCSLDPVYEQILARLPPGSSLYDWGGGRGYLGALHLLRAPAEVTLVDYDLGKLKAAAYWSSQSGRPIQMMSKDLQEINVDHSRSRVSALTLIDVLHYFEPGQERQVLNNAMNQIAPGGLLFIRDINADLNWQSRLTWLQEKCCLALGITRASRVRPLSFKSLAELLNANHFQVEIVESSAGILFANALLIASKKP